MKTKKNFKFFSWCQSTVGFLACSFSFTEKSVIAQPIFVFEKREQTFKVRSSYFSLTFTLTKKMVFQDLYIQSNSKWYHCCINLSCFSFSRVVPSEYLHSRDLQIAICLKWEARGLILELWITCHFYANYLGFLGMTWKGDGLKD